MTREGEKTTELEAAARRAYTAKWQSAPLKSSLCLRVRLSATACRHAAVCFLCDVFVTRGAVWRMHRLEAVRTMCVVQQRRLACAIDVC